MRPLAEAELLSVWEQGLSQPPDRQALLLLAAACPETPVQTLAELSIGQRDAGLLTLREWLFGAEVVALAVCPACREQVELNFTVADIRVHPPRLEPIPPQSITAAGYEVSFRLPNSLDLAALVGVGGVAAARRLLLNRCLIEASYQGRAVEEDLPLEALAAVESRMSEVDPQVEVQLALACPACAGEWSAVFDIVSFFWQEITAWAYRTLRQVHHLALAYGWREADILALSPWKRQFYLNLVHG